MDPLSILVDALIGGAIAGAGGRHGRSPHEEFGWPLLIVLLVMSAAGMWLFARTLNDGNEVGAFLYLLLPFGATYVSAVAGARGAQAMKAARISTALALAGGAALWLMMSVIDLMLWR